MATTPKSEKDDVPCVHQKWNEIQKKYETVVSSQSSSLSLSSGGIRTAATVLANDSEGSSWYYAEESGNNHNKHHRHHHPNSTDADDDDDFVVVEEQEAWHEEREDLRDQIDALQQQLAVKESAWKDLRVVHHGLEDRVREHEITIRLLQQESAEQQEWLRECQTDLLEQLQVQHEAQQQQEQEKLQLSKEIKETKTSSGNTKNAPDELKDPNDQDQLVEDTNDDPLSLEQELKNCRRLQQLLQERGESMNHKTTKQPPSPAALPPSLAKLRQVQSQELVDKMADLVQSVQDREKDMADIVACFSTDKGTTRFSPARDVTTATTTTTLALPRRLSLTKSTPTRTKSFGANSSAKSASIPLELYQAEMQEWKLAMAQFLQHSKELMTLYPQRQNDNHHHHHHRDSNSDIAFGEIIISQLNGVLQQAQTKMQNAMQQQPSLLGQAQPPSKENYNHESEDENTNTNNEDLARHWFAVVQQMEQDKEDELHLLDTVMEHLLKLEQQHLLKK